MKRIIIPVILIILVAGIGATVYLWNKAPETVDNKMAVSISATALSNAFLQDEQAANSRYLNKVLSVTGIVTVVDSNQDGNTVILLAGSGPLSDVQCSMRQGNLKVKKGETITVKGFCHGYTISVLLSECVLL